MRLQRAVHNTLWLFADKALRLGLGLVVWIWLARYLGVEQFGLYNYALAFVSLFGAFATLGLDSIVVRELVRNPKQRNEIIGTAFIMKGAAGMAVLALVSMIVIVIRPSEELTHWLVALVALGLIFQASDVIDCWFQSQLLSKYTVYARIAAFLTVAVAKIALLLQQAPLIAFAVAGSVEAALAAAGLIVAYRIQGQRLDSWRFGIRRGLTMLSESWPLIFSSTFVYINMQIDKIMIAHISGDTEVGIYSAASRLSELWYLIPMIVGASAAPLLIAARMNSLERYHRRLQMVYDFMSLCSLVAALVTTFIASTLISWLFGPHYAAAGHMLAVHVWSAVFVFHTSIRSRALVIEDKQGFVAIFAFFTMAYNIVFNLLLIPQFGGLGASYASLLSWMLCVLVTPYFSATTSDSVMMFFRSLNPFSRLTREVTGERG